MEHLIPTLTNCRYLESSLLESPVGLVIVRRGDRTNVMTVSFFSQAAHHPTSLWVSISPATLTYEWLLEVGEFTFVALSQGQADAAIRCGTVSGRDVDKSAMLDLYRTPDGLLYLRGALASTSCRVIRSQPAGDHTLFVAQILAGERDTRGSVKRQLLLSDLKSR